MSPAQLPYHAIHVLMITFRSNQGGLVIFVDAAKNHDIKSMVVSTFA
jgi:hypothetical protein